MRIRLLLITLILSICAPVPADALFNRDCSNLKKRVVKLQSQSDKAWDKYVTSIGKAKNKSYFMDGDEIFIRLRALVDIGLVITGDMKKYPKCISPTYIGAQWQTELKNIRLNGLVFKSELPFQSRFNYVKGLKK